MIRGPSLDPLRVDWQAFVVEQRRTAAERQRSRGLDGEWRGQIDGYLDEADSRAG